MPSCVQAPVAHGKTLLHCPFCGQEESERCVIDGRKMIIFPCMFSPAVDGVVPEEGLQAYLQERYGKDGRYLRRQCQALHSVAVVGSNEA